MRKKIARLAGMKHLLAFDPRTVTTPEQFNARLDEVCAILQAETVDVPEPAAPVAVEPDEEPELDLTGREDDSGQDRMERGGHDRSGE